MYNNALGYTALLYVCRRCTHAGSLSVRATPESFDVWTLFVRLSFALALAYCWQPVAWLMSECAQWGRWRLMDGHRVEWFHVPLMPGFSQRTRLVNPPTYTAHIFLLDV